MKFQKKLFEETLVFKIVTTGNAVVLKWINLNPISLPDIVNQKLLFLQKIYLCRTVLHRHRDDNDIWSSFSFHS